MAINNLKYSSVVVHYGEIGLKGNNRGYFENALLNNIKNSIHVEDIFRLSGRIIINLPKDITKGGIDKIKDSLSYQPGVTSFAFALESALDLSDIKKTIHRLAKHGNNMPNVFKIHTIRANKNFKYNSVEINGIIGEELTKLGYKVDLGNPLITFYIEISDKQAFAYTQKLKGIGGLPSGVTGKLVSLLSGGIDSPVAAYLMMKRGCEVVFIHFYYKQGSSAKVKKLVEILSKFQANSKLYLINFRNIQNEIIKAIPSKYRMITYKRAMLKIAQGILAKENALGIVTGDSVAQVASQTLENINVIYSAAKHPIFSPLIGMDKVEIIGLAKKISTYDTSILPHADCCSFLVDKHPATKARQTMIDSLENGLKIELLIKDAVDKAEVSLSRYTKNP